MKKIAKPPYFFSIDIEGAEFSILDQIIENANDIEGLVIEFHNINSHINQIKSFIKKLPLKLIHIHPCNFATIDKNGNPNVIDIYIL